MNGDGRDLDNPIHAALTGPHAGLAQRKGSALRYLPQVCPFAALPTDPDAAAWADLAALVGPERTAAVSAPRIAPPPGWVVDAEIPGVQLVAADLAAGPDPEVVRLGAADVPEMLALTARTRPGPFLPRTHEMGTYLGIRRRGELVAMAGERLRLPGWTEISAVCTDERYRGQGLATRLVHAVAAVIVARGEAPMMHAAASNENAIRLYLALGFRVRRHTRFATLRSPAERLDARIASGPVPGTAEMS